MNAKILGKIKNPEQYIRASWCCIVDNSYDAMLYLKEYNKGLYRKIGRNAKMIPIMATLKTINKDKVLFWAILDEEDNIKFMISAFDLFDYPEADILKFTKIEKDTFFLFEDVLYRIVFTSKGEAIIKLPRGIWAEKEVVEVLDLRGHENIKLCSIYPVKLFDSFTNKLICGCWTIEKEDCVYWYPMSFNDENRLVENDPENVCEIVLNVNDTVKVGKLTMVVRYSVKEGFYLEKTNMTIPFEGMQMSCKIKEEKTEAPKSKCSARIIKLPVPNR